MLRKTRLRALDGRIITVSNLVFITTTPVINYSKGEFIKVEVNTSISSSSDLPKAREIITRICSKNPNILPNIPQRSITSVTKFLEIPKNFFTVPKNIKDLTPSVIVKSVGKEKVDLQVWFWIWDVLMKKKIVSSFYEELIKEFEQNKIKFG
jgi:small-conductance mechanosensitive channel